jgi:eukaryotic-like serine/threonine-protein kinase
VIGRKLGNRYEVIERIGGGGMAVVFRALDTLLNRHVSIKVLRAQFANDEDFVRRFRREAQAAASLSHPNVVNIYDVGMEGEDYYIVMEYVDGLTLKEVIQDRAPLPVSEAIDIAKQICSALGHAHENNIVHRDIKPHNILIGKDGRIKVTDFGIARAITSNTITQDGSVLGSVHYFSPEQARGGITDVKSDIYSLGVVLYEMVTGELPFSGETPISVALKHLQEQFVEPRQLNPALPQSVENIVLKSLAKDPAVRYQSARDMGRDLEKALLYPNVPKFAVPKFDEQSTIQMPAVGLRAAGETARPAGGAVPPVMDKQPEQSAKSPDAAKTEEDPKKKRKFWRPVVWLFAIFILLGVGAVTAYSLVTNYMTEKDVTMPDVVGKQYDEAVKALVDAGLTEQNIKKEEKVEKDKQPGTVLEQDQYAGKTIKANRPVTLTVAKGTEKVSMPDVVGKSKDQAQARLTAAKISTAHVTYEDKEDKDATPGTILAQNPGPDATIDPDSEIKLTVAKAVPKIKMPDLTDMPQEDAKKRLTDLGLKVNQIFTSTNSEFAAGHVIRTTAVPGTEMSKGEPVDLFVSKGPDAVKKTVDVTVPAPKADSKVQVKIVRNDARGSQEVINETITADKKYSVDCVVQKDQIASIQVYLDGKPERTITVPYEGQ